MFIFLEDLLKAVCFIFQMKRTLLKKQTQFRINSLLIRETDDIYCVAYVFASGMCSIVVLHQWSLAVFLLCSPVTLDGRPVDALSSRM